MNNWTLSPNQQQNSKKSQTPATMLTSEFFVQIPKPQVLTKMVRRIQRSDPSQTPEFRSPHHYSKESPRRQEVQIMRSLKSDSNWTCGTSGKYSTSSSGMLREEKQIILEWIRKRFEKDNLLGPHWQALLCQKKKYILSICFQILKQQVSSSQLQNFPIKKRTDFEELKSKSLYQGLQILKKVFDRRRQFQIRIGWGRIEEKNKQRQKVRFVYEQDKTTKTKTKQYSNSSRSIQKTCYYHNSVQIKINPINDYENQRISLKKVLSGHLPFSTNQYSLTPLTILSSQIPSHHEKKLQIKQMSTFPHSKVLPQLISIPNTQIKGDRPLSHRPFLIESSLGNQRAIENPVNSANNIESRKRPVSAAPFLRVSCQLERQNQFQPKSTNNVKYLKMSFQSLPQKHQQANVSASMTQQENKIKSSYEEKGSSFNKIALRRAEEIDSQRIKWIPNLADNDYNMQGLVNNRPRNSILPRLMPG